MSACGAPEVSSYYYYYYYSRAAAAGDYTAATFAPDLQRFDMLSLDDGIVALLSKRVSGGGCAGGCSRRIASPRPADSSSLSSYPPNSAGVRHCRKEFVRRSQAGGAMTLNGTKVVVVAVARSRLEQGCIAMCDGHWRRW